MVSVGLVLNAYKARYSHVRIDGSYTDLTYTFYGTKCRIITNGLARGEKVYAIPLYGGRGMFDKFKLGPDELALRKEGKPIIKNGPKQIIGRLVCNPIFKFIASDELLVGKERSFQGIKRSDAEEVFQVLDLDAGKDAYALFVSSPKEINEVVATFTKRLRGVLELGGDWEPYSDIDYTRFSEKLRELNEMIPKMISGDDGAFVKADILLRQLPYVLIVDLTLSLHPLLPLDDARTRSIDAIRQFMTELERVSRHRGGPRIWKVTTELERIAIELGLTPPERHPENTVDVWRDIESREIPGLKDLFTAPKLEPKLKARLYEAMDSGDSSWSDNINYRGRLSLLAPQLSNELLLSTNRIIREIDHFRALIVLIREQCDRVGTLGEPERGRRFNELLQGIERAKRKMKESTFQYVWLEQLEKEIKTKFDKSTE